MFEIDKEELSKQETECFKIVDLAAYLCDYLREDNRLQIRFKSIYDGLHQKEYDRRFNRFNR